MKIKLSKSQWETIGKTAGWLNPSDKWMKENGICVYDYSEKDQKFATDCDTMVSGKFADELIANDGKDARCPKCGKKIDLRGRIVEDDSGSDDFDPRDIPYGGGIDRSPSSGGLNSDYGKSWRI